MPLCHQDLAQVTRRYVVLKGRVSGLAGVSGGALQRVMQLTAEARDLLDKASSSKRKLEGEGGVCGWGGIPHHPDPARCPPPRACLPLVPQGTSRSVPQGWCGPVTRRGAAP